jgi:hypothetical protein
MSESSHCCGTHSQTLFPASWKNETKIILKKKFSQALVSHFCNPSQSGGRDQEGCSSKPALANSSMRLFLKKPFTKIGLVEWLKVKALSSSPSTAKK